MIILSLILDLLFFENVVMIISIFDSWCIIYENVFMINLFIHNRVSFKLKCN